MVYSSFGAAVSEVELDVLTGEKLVKRCDIHFDCGQSLNPMIDLGQVRSTDLCPLTFHGLVFKFWSSCQFGRPLNAIFLGASLMLWHKE